LPQATRKALWATLSAKEKAALEYYWPFWARPDQLAPQGDWTTWLILSGRGWGKTRTGVEWVREEQASGGRGRFALVGRTAADARDVIVEGESGILATAPPWNRPTYEPSKRRVTWPNGAVATTYSADEPDQLRGPQHDGFLADEVAAWPAETWDQLQFGLRLGKRPRGVAATTPRPTPLIRKLLASPSTHATRGSTFDNKANLAPSFLREVLERYEGTRLGRQELYGEILTDVAGALWNLATLEAARVPEAPEMGRVVVAIDPAVSTTESSDETGLVVCGFGTDGLGYVLEDASGKYAPNEWAAKAMALYKRHHANAIVVEVNQGGDLVTSTLRTVDKTVPIKTVHASRGKRARAEPIAALFEQGKVKMLPGLTKLSDQLTSWDATSPTAKSPDRLDAMVYALSDLMLKSSAAYNPALDAFIPKNAYR
jgi:predicted phage terminase large subunit-like protein